MFSTFLLITSFLISDYLFLTVALILLSLVLVYKTRKNILCFISSFMIAYSNYSIVIYRYWKPDSMPYTEITTSTGDIDVTGLRICVLLVYVILIILNHKLADKQDKESGVSISDSQMPKPNFLLVLITCCALIYIWTNYFEFTFGEKSGYSPQYEYSTVFFVIGFYYAQKKWYLKLPLLLLALFYILFDFIGGQRSTGVQISIIVALTVFYKYLSVKRIFVYGSIGLIIVNVVAALRGAILTPDFSFSDLLSSMTDTWFASDTAGHAYYTSLTYIGTMQYYGIVERLSQFSDFVASLLVVGTVGEALPYIAERHFYHNFGGILGIYMYYYLWYFGTILIGSLVAFYYVLMYRLKSRINWNKGITYVVAVYISATTVRWYVYSPFQLLRGAMLLVLVYFAYSIFYKLTTK